VVIDFVERLITTAINGRPICGKNWTESKIQKKCLDKQTLFVHSHAFYGAC